MRYVRQLSPTIMNTLPHSRRTVMKLGLGLAVGSALPCRVSAAIASAEANVETAHAEIWRRFVDPFDILVDYADEEGRFPRPTPEECREGKPNALGWWTPVENGSMFNGMYLDGICTRWQHTRAEADRIKAQRLVKGLLRLASLGPPGFIARGVATDGRTPYPMGSNDQTMPWLYGLWRYLRSDLATGAERAEIVAKFVELASVLESKGWRMPCLEGAPSPFRGTFANFTWECAPRLLFLLKATHDLTGEARWDQLYHRLAQESGGEPSLTRLEICTRGMIYHRPTWRESWTGAPGVCALRALWELETDPTRRDIYARGLKASLQMAADSLPLAEKYPNANQLAFLHDWRVLNAWWRPQHTEQEAVDVAERQSKELGRRSPRRYQEFVFVREPVFAAWVMTLCPDRTLVLPHREAILKVLAHYRYDRLYYSQFFPAEAAWYRLKALQPG